MLQSRGLLKAINLIPRIPRIPRFIGGPVACENYTLVANFFLSFYLIIDSCLQNDTTECCWPGVVSDHPLGLILLLLSLVSSSS